MSLQSGSRSWEVDDRPPSWYTRIYVRGMWAARDKRAFEGGSSTLETARKRQRRGDRAPTPWTRLTRRVQQTEMAEMTAWRVRPRRRPVAARVLYLHGGGYIHPLTPDYWRLVRALTGAPAEVVVPAYPLAPDATVDEVLPRLVRLYDEVRADDPTVPIVLMGDSAGGALVLVVANELRARSAPPPAALVALSPWLDATLSDPEVRDLEPSDPMLAETGLLAAGRWWAGARSPEDPLVSPVGANLANLPPIDLFIGDRDILRPAVDRFVERAGEAGADLHVHEVAAMFHVWMTRAIPEARRTRTQLRDLVRARSS